MNRRIPMHEDTANIHATERRVFYIDIGDMPTHQVTAYLEEVKNNLHQKKLCANSTNDKW